MSLANPRKYFWPAITLALLAASAAAACFRPVQNRNFDSQLQRSVNHVSSRSIGEQDSTVKMTIRESLKNNTVAEKKDDVQTGRDLILNHRFLPKDFHQSTFDELWKDWPEPLRKRAEAADKKTRTQLAFERYGFSSRPDEANKPLQYVVEQDGWWSMNCFACHGGKVNGKTIEGLPNSHIALQTLYEDLRRTKKRLGLPFNTMDTGSIVVPMGSSKGTSNAVVFGIVLMAFRDKDLNLKRVTPRPFVIHHDMDAPAWWHVKKRDRLYIDGFVEKGHRALIPFVMDQSNSGETMRGWEQKFKKVYAYINSLEAPKYPFKIDAARAEAGKEIFVDHCSSCHGTYGKSPTYPARIVDIDKVKTDSIRLKALTEYDRKVYHESWFAGYGKDKTVIKPKGYQAPPLDGIWASAPYFHNGSVPTLNGVLNPDQRPKVWRRTENDYDQKKVGLKFEAFDAMPKTIKRSDQKRLFFDTGKRGKSATGHPFADPLSDTEKQNLLEYLKTL